jgi:hypothetical protein
MKRALLGTVLSLLTVSCADNVTVDADPVPPGAGPVGADPGCDTGTWARSFPGSPWTPGSVAVTADCGLIVSGGPLDLGLGPEGAAGSVAVARLDAGGTPRWVRRFGADGALPPPLTAVDAEGDVLLAGIATAAVDFGAGPMESVGKKDLVVARLDAAGGLRWARRFGTPGGLGFTSLDGIAVTPGGRVIVAGSYQGNADLGGPAPLPAAENGAGYLAALDGAGQTVWQRGLANAFPLGDGGVRAHGVAAGADGRVVVTGWYLAALDAGTGPLPETNSDGFAFAAAYTAEGAPLWSRAFTGPGVGEATRAAVDAAGNVVVAGSLGGTLAFDGFTLSTSDTDHAFLAALDPTGATRFARTMPGGASVGVAVDAAGGILFAGDALVKLDPAGAVVWSRANGLHWLAPGAAALDPTGHVVATGTYQGTLDLGTASLHDAAETPETFVARLPP